jgi:acetolactate synthase-1/2/3 large subunit
METMPMTSLEPSPDYAAIAAASRGWSENVEDAADLPGAIGRAVEVIRKEKRQALLNVTVGY